jgi:hypothetical protein
MPSAVPAAEQNARTPPPARVPQNRWTEIEAPSLERFEPRARVAVHVGGEDPDGLAPLTLAALAAQRYPRELVAVVVDEALTSDALTATARELSLALAPATGDPVTAAAGAGELAVFLAAGAIPAPQCLAAHARWHETVSDAVTVGRSRRIDAHSASAERLAAGAPADELQALADDGEAAALEAFLAATRSLTERRADLFRVAAGQNVAVRSALLAELGEARAPHDPRLWRLDLAYRLEQAGCVFVPEAEAESFHHYPQANWLEAEPQRASDQRSASLIPLPGFRPPGGGRLRERPALAVAVKAQPDEPAAEILQTVDCLLAGRLSDLRLSLELADDHPARAELAAACAADPRVALQRPGQAAVADAPYQVRWPALAVADERTLSDLYELIAEEGVGALHVTVPGRLDRFLGERPRLAERAWRGPTVEVAATGPLARARRLASSSDSSPDSRSADPTLLLGSLFGERWVSGVEVGVHRRGAPAPEAGERHRLPPAADLAHERAEHLRHRARAATNQARSHRQAQRAVRERLRASNERLRAERLEARLARVSPSYWARWRAKRAVLRARTVPGQVGGALGRGRKLAYRYRQGALARVRR